MCISLAQNNVRFFNLNKLHMEHRQRPPDGQLGAALVIRRLHQPLQPRHWWRVPTVGVQRPRLVSLGGVGGAATASRGAQARKAKPTGIRRGRWPDLKMPAKAAGSDRRKMQGGLGDHPTEPRRDRPAPKPLSLAKMRRIVRRILILEARARISRSFAPERE